MTWKTQNQVNEPVSEDEAAEQLGVSALALRLMAAAGCPVGRHCDYGPTVASLAAVARFFNVSERTRSELEITRNARGAGTLSIVVGIGLAPATAPAGTLAHHRKSQPQTEASLRRPQPRSHALLSR